MTSSANAEPKGSEPSSSDLCKCGHPRTNHHWHAAQGEGCIGNRNLCRCRMFQEKPKPCTCGPDEACGDPCEYEPHEHDYEYQTGGVHKCACGAVALMAEPGTEPPMTPEEEEQAPPDEGRSKACAWAAGCRWPHSTQCEHGCQWAADELAREANEKPPPQPDRRPPYAVAYSVQGHLYEVAVSGDARVRAVDGVLVISHPLGPVAGIAEVGPFGEVTDASQ